MELLRGRFRLQKDHPTVWVLIGLCVAANLLIDASHSPVPRLARFMAFALVIWCISKRWHRWLLMLVITLLCSYGTFYHTGANSIVSKAAPTPVRPVAEVRASVIPGGDRLEICTVDGHLVVRVCYYLGDGSAIAAAHRGDLSVGEHKVALEGIHLRDPISVVADTNYGLVIEGYPPTPTDRTPLPIASAAEIMVGEKGMVLQGDEPPIEVQIKGFQDANGVQKLVLTPAATRDPRLRPGSSGSPVVQNGKIIGFIHSGVFVKGTVSYARLAADIYNGIEAR